MGKAQATYRNVAIVQDIGIEIAVFVVIEKTRMGRKTGFCQIIGLGLFTKG